MKSDDIFSLVVTLNNDLDDQLSIPGFKRVKVKNRPSNSLKSSGGWHILPEIEFLIPLFLSTTTMLILYG